MRLSFNSKLMPLAENRFTKYLFFLVVAIYIISLPNRSTGMDESVLAEQAYWFSEDGLVKSKLFAGMGQGWEDLQLHYHRLFIWIGALAIKIFGFTWYIFKVIPMLFLVLFLFLYSKYISEERLGLFLYLALSLILLNYYIFSFSFFYRPEVIVMFFGFASYYCLNKGLKEKPVYILSSGFLAAVAALVHLNGLMFLAAGGLLLLFNKKYKLTLLFSVAGIFGLFFYFIELLSPDNFQLFLSQILHDPNLKEDTSGLFFPIQKLLNEHQRLFRGPREIIMTAIPLLSLVLNFRYLRKYHSNLLIYTFILIIFMSVTAHGISPKYMLVYFPFFILIFLHSLQNPELGKWFLRVSRLLILCYFPIQVIFLIPMMKEGFNVPERSKFLSSFIEEERASVLASYSFVFDQLPKHDINGFLGYRYKIFNYDGRNPGEVPASDLFNFARESGRDYIIVDVRSIDLRVLEILDFEKLEKGREYYGYYLVDKGNDYAIFKILNK